MKNFQYCSQKRTVRKGDKEKQIAAERDIFGMLMSTSYKAKEAVNLEASLVYPLPNHPPEYCVPSGARKKCGKQLPGKETLHTYFLDVMALMRVLS